MKNFIKFFGIIALAVVVMFGMVACGDDDDSGGGSDRRGELVGEWTKDGSTNQEVFLVEQSNDRVAAYFKSGTAGVSQYSIEVESYDGTTVKPESHSQDQFTFTATISGDKLTISGVPPTEETTYFPAYDFNGIYTKKP